MKDISTVVYRREIITATLLVIVGLLEGLLINKLAGETEFLILIMVSFVPYAMDGVSEKIRKIANPDVLLKISVIIAVGDAIITAGIGFTPEIFVPANMAYTGAFSIVHGLLGDIWSEKAPYVNKREWSLVVRKKRSYQGLAALITLGILLGVESLVGVSYIAVSVITSILLVIYTVVNYRQYKEVIAI